MSKRIRNSKRKKRPTNWWVVGGLMAGAVVLLGLVALAFRGPNELQLAKFCDNNPENCMVAGSDKAPITVVEVSDYGCGHCREFNQTTAVSLHEQYVATGRVKWIVMPFALTDQFGNARTLESAVAGFCAAEQELFAPYHQALFNLQDTPLFNTREGFISAAQATGLDSDAFAACLANNDYTAVVQRNIQVASKAGIHSTPSFVVDGELISGNLPLAVFQQRLDALLGAR